MLSYKELPVTLEHGDAALSVSYFLWLKRPGIRTKAYLLWTNNTKRNQANPDRSAPQNNGVQDFEKLA